MSIQLIKLILDSNKAAKQTLDALSSNGRFPHALVIECDDDIIAKYFLIYASALALCEQDTPPCLNCQGCLKILKGIHPDVIQTGEELQKSYSIDNVRELKHRAFVLPNDAKRSVFILKNADTIPEKSQNALLKIIEEPPQHTVFILQCKNAFNLLPTVISRVIKIKLLNADIAVNKKILGLMCEEVSSQTIDDALALSGNSLWCAYSIIKDDQTVLKPAVKLYEAIAAQDRYNLPSTINELLKSKQSIEIIKYLRQVIIQGSSEYFKNDYTAFKLTPTNVIQLVDIIDDTIKMLGQNVNTSLLCCYMTERFSQALKK